MIRKGGNVTVLGFIFCFQESHRGGSKMRSTLIVVPSSQGGGINGQGPVPAAERQKSRSPRPL